MIKPRRDFDKREDKFKKDVMKTATCLAMGYIVGGFLIMLYDGFPTQRIFGLIIGSYSVAFVYKFFGGNTP